MNWKAVGSFLGRYGSIALALTILAQWIFDQAAVKTLAVCVEAGLITVVLSSFAAWAYTNVAFDRPEVSDQKNDLGEPWLNEIVTAARTRVLGYIYLGTCILVGLVFFGVYYIQTIPN